MAVSAVSAASFKVFSSCLSSRMIETTTGPSKALLESSCSNQSFCGDGARDALLSMAPTVPLHSLNQTEPL